MAAVPVRMWTWTDEWQNGMDNMRPVGVVMLDFNAAFVGTHHMLLFDILVMLMLWFWLKGFVMAEHLSQRKQRVFFDGSSSNRTVLMCGVP